MKKILPPSKLDATKMCWWCKNFYYSRGEPGWSEYTPGSDFSIECLKSHWAFEQDSTSKDEFRNMISHAVDCADFESILLQEKI